MDYMIFNVRTSLFVCVHVHTDSESAQHFLLGETLTNFSCAPDAGGVRTSDLWIPNPKVYQLSHSVIPFDVVYWNVCVCVLK